VTHEGFNENLQTASHLSSACEGGKSGEKEVAAVDSSERMNETVLGSRKGKKGSAHNFLKVTLVHDVTIFFFLLQKIH